MPMVTLHARIELQHPRTSNSQEQTIKDIRLLRYKSTCQINSHSLTVFYECDSGNGFKQTRRNCFLAGTRLHAWECSPSSVISESRAKAFLRTPTGFWKEQLYFFSRFVVKDDYWLTVLIDRYIVSKPFPTNVHNIHHWQSILHIFSPHSIQNDLRPRLPLNPSPI